MLPQTTKLTLARVAAAVAANMTRRTMHMTAVAASGGHHEALNDGPAIAAGREHVAYFLNGEPMYSDRLDMPFPAIRFRKMNAEYKALREKEKGDWKNLSLEEKKKLYRFTFRATLAEFDHPTGHWKVITGIVLLACTLTMGIMTLVKRWAMKGDLWYLSEEAKNKQLEMMIRLYSDPVTGVASKWDYDKNVWKG